MERAGDSPGSLSTSDVSPSKANPAAVPLQSSSAEKTQPQRDVETEEMQIQTQRTRQQAAEMEELRSKIASAVATDPAIWQLTSRHSDKLGPSEMQTALRRGLQLPPSVVSDEEILRLWDSLNADSQGCVSVSALASFLGQDFAAAVEKTTTAGDTSEGRCTSQGDAGQAANIYITTQSTDAPSHHASMTMTMTSTTTTTMKVEQSRWVATDVDTLGGPPKDHAAWATHTQLHLSNVRHLRQEAQNQLMKNAMSATVTQSTFAVVRQRNPIQDEVMRGVAAAESLSRLLVERIDTLERLIRQVGLCMTHLQRSRNAKLPHLTVAEKRLEMRRKRPSQEMVQDHFQDALEKEFRTLAEVRQALAEHIDAGKEFLEKLESSKDELLVGMQRKRHALRFDRAHLVGPDEALGEDRKNALPQAASIVQSARSACGEQRRELHTQQWVSQVQEMLARSMPMEAEAARFCSEADTAVVRAERQAERAMARTTISMKKRINEIVELKKQLEKEIKETSETMSQAETALHNLQRQIEKPVVTGLQIDALQEQQRWTKGVLEQLSEARQQLISDLQCKNLAWRIDESCSKVTPIKELELDNVAAPRKKPDELQLPTLRKRGLPLKPELLEKLRTKVKAAAYTGTSGRQLDVIFGRFDRDHSGQLSDEEVRLALRRTLRIPPSTVPDHEIYSLCATLDADNSGQVSISELVDFVGVDPEVSKRTGKSLSALPVARKPPPPPTVLEPEVAERLRAKIKAAAYTGHSGRQLDVIFSRFDKDGSGQLEVDEVRKALRRTLRIAPLVITDAEISKLCATLDTDHSGSVSIKELMDFVGVEPEVSKRTGKSIAGISLNIAAPPKKELDPDVVEKLRSKIKAAAYTGHSGRQLDVVFGRFDHDGSGNLEVEEVKRALRRSLRIPASMIADAEISSLCKMLDTDRSGTVSIGELVDFIGPEPETSKRTGKSLSHEPGQAPKIKPPPPPRLEPEMLEKVRSKIKAAAYTGVSNKSGRNFEALFSEFDRDDSGQLELEEVKRALRRTLKISPSDISDGLIAQLCSTLDADASGSVSIKELVEFIGAEPTVSKRTGKVLNEQHSHPRDRKSVV